MKDTSQLNFTIEVNVALRQVWDCLLCGINDGKGFPYPPKTKSFDMDVIIRSYGFMIMEMDRSGLGQVIGVAVLNHVNMKGVLPPR